MTKEEKKYLLDALQEAKHAFSNGDIEKEQRLVEDAINFVSSH